jgi:Ca2+-binding EF-hand superfamily protein
MPFPALILSILAAAAQSPEAKANPIFVTGHMWAPFISPMGEPFRARAPGQDTLGDWFRKADRNHDGLLTADEMQADAERFFATLDTDHDGEVEPAELVQYEWEVAPEIQIGSRWRRSRSRANTAQAASREPARGNGDRRRGDANEADDSRSSDGLDYGLQGAGRYTLLNLPEPVAAADADLDRAISLSEFRQASIDRFRLLDQKRQGRLSLQDLEALRPPEFVPGHHAKRRKDSADTRVGVPLPPGD